MTLKIVQRKVGELTAYAANARTHSPAQVAQIAASITEFGWTNPLLIDPDGGLVAGHGRLAAAESLGLARVPCIVLDDLTPEQRRAYVLADNQLALNAGWDDAILESELAALTVSDYDLSVIGFSDKELAALMSPTEGETDPDSVPEPPAAPVTKPGDLYVLGDHRLLCGDATSAEDVTRLLGGAVPNLMVTDPPYGVNYDPAWRSGAKRTGKVANDDRHDWHEAYALFPGDVAYVWHGYKMLVPLAGHLDECGFDRRALIVWAKPSLVMSRGHYHWQFESAWYAVRKKGTARWIGDRSQATVWSFDSVRANRDRDGENEATSHGTQKPVECMARPIRNHEGDVYDPFVGSGTTIIAAEQLGRRCYAMEIDPVYVDVAVKRWEEFTGREAVKI